MPLLTDTECSPFKDASALARVEPLGCVPESGQLCSWLWILWKNPARTNNADMERLPCFQQRLNRSHRDLRNQSPSHPPSFPHKIQKLRIHFLRPMTFAHSFSFAGGGWMMVYEFGVAKALQHFGVAQHARFIGASAGALAATALALETDFDAVRDMIADEHVAIAYGSVHAAERPAGQGDDRGHVTSLSAFRSRRKTRGFESGDHLLQTLLASCCLPPLAGLPFRLDGEFILDDGILDSQPLFEDDPQGTNTVAISPNYFSNADIRPSHYFPPWWFAFPSSREDTLWAYELGEADAIRWLVSKGLAPESELAKADRVQPLQWKTRVGRWTGYRALDAGLTQAALTLLTVAGAVAVALLQLAHAHATSVVRQRGAAMYALGLGTSLLVALLSV